MPIKGTGSARKTGALKAIDEEKPEPMLALPPAETSGGSP